MKKVMLALAAVMLLSGCVGFVDGKAKNGKAVHDVYLFHPAITISGYTSSL